MLSTGPIAEILNGGEYFLPCSNNTLPEQRTAELNSTRWSIIIMDSAPPAHSAFTTASMSCWCTT